MLLHPHTSSALIPLLFIYSTHTLVRLHGLLGRTMAQAANRRPLTAEPWVQSRASACGMCGMQIVTGKSSYVFSSQHHSTNVLYSSPYL